MLDKTVLGSRYTCFQCGTKFYDLNRPAPTCPECGADQTEAPVQDIKSLLSKGGGRRRKAAEPEEEEEALKPAMEESDGDDDDDDDDDDDMGLLGDDQDLD